MRWARTLKPWTRYRPDPAENPVAGPFTMAAFATDQNPEMDMFTEDAWLDYVAETFARQCRPAPPRRG